jgi:hypothetical protein
MNVFRSSIVPQLSGFEGYIAEIGNRFCPFLEPSAMRDLTLYSTYELGSGSVEQIQALMFCIGLLHTEILRRARVEVPLQQRPLVCENILFRFASEDCVDGVELFGWPHWLLKVRYTQVGVLFGKFWKGEEAVSRKSVPIPPPPYHMLSIRGAVKPRDPAFFTKAPELLDTLISAEDNGQFIFNDMEIGGELKSLIESPCETVEESLVICRRILESFDLYQRLYLVEAKKREVIS